MKLLIDVGNTTTRTILYEENGLRSPRTVETRSGRTPDEWWALWDELYGTVFEPNLELVGVSVVPEVTDTLLRMGEQYLTNPIEFLVAPWKGPVSIGRPDPEELGGDRYAGAVGLFTEFGPGIVVDFGTATTVDAVDRNGNYQGGLIHPGVKTGLNGLRRHAALLPGVALDLPETLDTSTTRGALQGGLFYGQAGAVDRMIRAVRERVDLPAEAPVVATGGYAEAFVTLVEDITVHEPNLVLKGLSKLL